MADLAYRLVHEEGVQHCRIVEVGCGKGLFLRMMVEEPSFGNTGIGFDPSYVGRDSDLDGRLTFQRRFYDEACADVPADVVICRHVIEHVSQPLDLLRTVRKALSHSPNPHIYFETPCVEWILRNKVIWDFFYEHCSLFSASSLRTAFERSGFAVHHVNHVFGDQYLWLKAGLAQESSSSTIPSDTPALARAFASHESRLRDAWLARVHALRSSGKVAVWGAGAKGTTFAQLIDPEGELIDCLVDLNPGKQGKFVPATGHAIVSVAALATRGVASAILMNPNYREENEALLGAAGLSIQLIE